MICMVLLCLTDTFCAFVNKRPINLVSPCRVGINKIVKCLDIKKSQEKCFAEYVNLLCLFSFICKLLFSCFPFFLLRFFPFVLFTFQLWAFNVIIVFNVVVVVFFRDTETSSLQLALSLKLH